MIESVDTRDLPEGKETWGRAEVPTTPELQHHAVRGRLDPGRALVDEFSENLARNGSIVFDEFKINHATFSTARSLGARLLLRAQSSMPMPDPPLAIRNGLAA
jgi:hypothetical protein